MTSTDTYFLSDGLYVSEEQLENSKPLRLSVVRVNPVHAAHQSLKGKKEKYSQIKIRKNVIIEISSSYRFMYCLHFVSDQKTRENTATWSRKRSRTECAQAGEGSSCELFLAATGTVKPEEGSNVKTEQRMRDATQREDVDNEGSIDYVAKRMSSCLTETEPFILDIDLDFFSCKNPFKELYTQVHYSTIHTTGKHSETCIILLYII